MTKKTKRREVQDNLKLKVQLYIMSLWLLFVLIFMLTVDIPISLDPEAKFIGWKDASPILKLNISNDEIIAFTKNTPVLSDKFKYSPDGRSIRLD